jgi:hypothetical protein
LQAFAEPHAGIETALHHVLEPVLGNEVEHDVGIRGGKSAQSAR